MLKGENLICISSIDWDFIWQGHQEIMSYLAKEDNRVLFMENTGVRTPTLRDISRIGKRLKNWLKGISGIRKQGQNLYIFSPLVLPFPYSRLAEWINKHLLMSVLDKWIKAMDFSDPIIWTFLPTPLALDIIDSIMKKIVIYYCIDNFSSSSSTAKKIRKSEIKLLKQADLVFVTSHSLYKYCSLYSKKVYLFPFAVNFERFSFVSSENNGNCIPDDLKKIPQPIIGYVGGIHRWIDQKLISRLAKKHPDYSFVFVGPLQTNVSILARYNNIYFLGNRDHRVLPYYIKEFAVCIIPYLLTEYTKNVYPTKLNEYLAMGKAVVTTDLPEIRYFNKEFEKVIYISKDENDFSQNISKAILDNDHTKKIRRIEIAKRNSWSVRIEQMCTLIENETERKKNEIETNWKEKLIYFYRKTKRNVTRLVIWLFLFYLIIFKTSLLWFFASPLKIENKPIKADAIVVFGGGVGETGSPGKSTIERARYAAELYNKGYANKIIFSSGYTYTYNDSENMRLIALSMGVKDKDIILEQKGDFTYQNVIFSKGILDKRGWKRILLISSPYNMRRASLVFKKWANDIEVIYTPVKKCQFFDRRYGVKLSHIRAILHEYLGIVYYWFKGYI